MSYGFLVPFKKTMSSYKQRAYIIHHHGSLNNCTPSDPRDLTKRAIEIFRKLVDPENEYLEEEIEDLKRQPLKDFILRKGGTQDDITAKSKTELRAIGEFYSLVFISRSSYLRFRSW